MLGVLGGATHAHRRVLVALLVASALVPGAANAQAPSVRFAVGVTTPTGDFANAYRTGFHALASVRLPFPGTTRHFRADAELHRLPETFSDRASLLFGLTANGTPHLVALGGAGQLYGVLGTGYHLRDTSVGRPEGALALQAGLGLRFERGGRVAFLEARIVDGIGNSEYRFVPVMLGIAF